jgi:predicted kinase
LSAAKEVVTITATVQAMPAPTVFLLTGLPCSGKSTYSRALEQQGLTRLSLDELMYAKHGRAGKDYPGHEQPLLEPAVLQDLKARVTALIRAGTSVVVDHGLGTRAAREEWKRIVEDAGGRWRLISFEEPLPVLKQRLRLRNADPAHGVLTEDTLDWMVANSETPVGEGEEPPGSTPA